MGSKMNKLYSFEHLIVLFNLDGSHLLYFSYYNNFTMNKLDPKYRRFVNLQGYLEKKSENLFVGFQMKYSILFITDIGEFFKMAPKSAIPIKKMMSSRLKTFS